MTGRGKDRVFGPVYNQSANIKCISFLIAAPSKNCGNFTCLPDFLSSYLFTRLIQPILYNFKMKKIILGLALITIACSMHLLNVQNLNTHEAALPAVHPGVNLAEAKKEFLSKIPQGPTVDASKAAEIKQFLQTPMGKSILSYFDSITVQPDGKPGLNLYKLSDRNFREWLAIKILAGSDDNLYARSFAANAPLFEEYIQNTSK